MIEVELVSGALQLVAKVNLPPFQTMPEALQWGDRTFVAYGQARNADGSERRYVYREVFCYVVPIVAP